MQFGDGFTCSGERDHRLKIPRPPDALPPKNNIVENFIYVTRRYKGTYHGFDFVCGFCGVKKKATSAQVWCHLAQRSWGGTHCQPCMEVPEEVVLLLLKDRELSEARRALKSKRYSAPPGSRTDLPAPSVSNIPTLSISAADLSVAFVSDLPISRAFPLEAIPFNNLPPGQRIVQVDIHPNEIEHFSAPIRRGFQLKIPEPFNALPFRKNTIEEFLYIMRRYQGGSYHGFDFICGFCGVQKKCTTAQAWCHLARRSRGQTHCQPCSEVPEGVSVMLIEEREETDAKKADRKRRIWPIDEPMQGEATASNNISSDPPLDNHVPDKRTRQDFSITAITTPEFPLKIPAPPNVLPSRKDSIEKYLHITRRYRGSFHGFEFVCGFCGLVKKSTSAQAWCHLTRRSRGETHCQPCPQVPAELADLLYKEREEGFARKGQNRNSTAFGEGTVVSSNPSGRAVGVVSDYLHSVSGNGRIQPNSREFSDVYN